MKLSKILFVLLLSVLLFACKTQKTADVQRTSTDSSIYKQTLKPYAINPDSAIVRALFECDSNRNVVLKQFEDYKTKGLQSNYSFSNGFLNFAITQPADTIWLPSERIEKYKDRYITKTYRITITKTVNVLYWYQKILIWVGLVSLCLIIIFLLFKYLKRKAYA